MRHFCNRLLLLILSAVTAGAARAQTADIRAGWPAYGGDPGGARYSTLDAITRTNVARLEVAWTYRTGELGQNADDGDELTFEATPLLFEGRLYVSTAFGRVIALHPATGTEQWTFDPGVARDRSYAEVTSRGVSAWRDPIARRGDACATRIYVATIDARLIALDAADGRPCADFGVGGTIELARAVDMSGNGDYQVTSPPAVIGDRIVVGSSIGDNWNRDTGSGIVRAFDARTGATLWSWDPIPRDSAGFRAGAANAWAPIAADPSRDMVFVPTSSPSPDFHGGDRPGDNRWANSVVALRASTGKLVWAFQTVHHDLWDYDLAAQPALVEIERGGERVPVVVQATKTGSLFVLHRETGEPVFPIDERAVPPSDVPGERAWPTQPFSVVPRSLMPHTLRPEDAWGPDDESRIACRDMIAAARHGDIFTPPSLDGTMMFPGNGSGTNWGSVAFDPSRNRLILNTSRLITYVQLLTRADLERLRDSEPGYEYGRMAGSRYGMRRKTVLSPAGLPCNPPPWGTLAGVDLTTGDVVWEIPFGEMPSGTGLPATAASVRGWPGSGGPIATAGGVVFIGASRDRMFRVFDTDTGAELWRYELPRAAFATPMTYAADGRQFVVIAAGGHGKANLETGDFVIAFALPESR